MMKRSLTLMTIVCVICSFVTIPVCMSAEKNVDTVKQTQESVESGVSSLIDINNADEELLIGLPGIGPKTAAKIAQYRKENGPFKAVDDLVKVKGIGPKVLEKLRPFATVS